MPTLEETILTFLGDMSRSKHTTNFSFTEENGVTGEVSMAYIYSIPFRDNPETRELIIKRIEVFGKSVVTPTLQKVLRNTNLNKIKIESIQNDDWIERLRAKGWTIEIDHGNLEHAVLKKGGKRKRSKRNRKRSRSITWKRRFI